MTKIKLEDLKVGNTYFKQESKKKIEIRFSGEKNGLYTFIDVKNPKLKHMFLKVDIEKSIYEIVKKEE